MSLPPDLCGLVQPHEDVQQIPVLISTRCSPPPMKKIGHRSRSNLINIRRSNRPATAASLPSIMVANVRSLFPKLEAVIAEIKEMDVTVSLLSEVWEDSENKQHANMVKTALEINGLCYISTPRPDRRGGGVAIAMINNPRFDLIKLDLGPVHGGSAL